MVQAVKRPKLQKPGPDQWKCSCGVLNERRVPRCHACRGLKHPGLQPARGTVPGKPAKTAPLESPSKHEGNGASGTLPAAKVWKCPDCRGETPEPLPCCNVCSAPSNPRLTDLQQSLADAMSPTEGAVDAWLALRHPGATDSEVLSTLASVLGPEGHRPGLCWRVVEDEAAIHVWPTDKPGDDVAALDEVELIEHVRAVYLIPVSPANGKPKRAEASAEPPPPHGVESDVPIGDIVVGEKNPRVHFDEAKLQEAAESLKKHGQLQNLVVWQPDRLKAKGQYELIAGERRLRAGKIAGRPTMRCRILHGITEAQATELRGIENLIREDLTPIETARWYQQMLDLTKPDGSKLYTQASLAERLKCSQPTIANRLRLLRLPDEWQQRIIRREISESHALEIVAWCDLPDVLAGCAKDLESGEGAPPLKTWRTWVRQNADNASRPMTPGERYHIDTPRGYEFGTVLFSAEDVERLAEQLDVRTVEGGYDGPEKRAFNVKEWHKLHGKLKAKQTREEQKKAAEQAAAPKATGKSAKAGASRAQAEASLRRAYADYYLKWHEAKVAEAVKSPKTIAAASLLKLALAIGFSDRWLWEREFESVLNKLKVPKARKRKETPAYLSHFLGVFDRIAQMQDPERVLREVLAEKLTAGQIDDPSGYAPIAQLAGLELARDWTVDRAYLEMHEVWQLKALAEEWKLSIEFADPVKETPAAKKKAIDAILAAAKSKRLPIPKALVDAKESV